jgi:hypothetical protein
MGFSEGCQGVGATLTCRDASAIDIVIACDGIHTQYTDSITKAINPANLGQYIAFANSAIADGKPSTNPDGKVFVITHSAIRPPYASTTETAQVIWHEATKNITDAETADCGFDCPAAVAESDLASVSWPNADFPVGMSLPGNSTIDASGYITTRPSAAETNFMPPATFTWSGINDGWTQRLNANGLHILGWSYPTPNGTKDPTGNRDHVFQAQMVLPYVAAEYLVKRWNPNCAVSGFGVDGSYEGFGLGGACAPGHGRDYYSGPATPLKNPYPIGVGVPLRSGACPVNPGQVVVGRPGDPCWIPGSPLPAKEPGTPSAFYEDAGKTLLVLGAAAAGAAGVWSVMKRRR